MLLSCLFLGVCALEQEQRLHSSESIRCIFFTPQGTLAQVTFSSNLGLA